VPLLATHIKISAVGIIHPLCANKIILSMKIILDCQTALIFSNIPPTQAARQAGRPEFGRKYKVGHCQIQIGPPRVETSEPLRHPIAELMLARQVLGYGLKFGALDILVNCAGDGHQGRQRARLFRARLDFSFDLNVKSMHLTIKAFLPAMLQKRGGSSTFSQ
jgi:NAD(P)-dependent dehydrogenase (short-subunit alcohol dehydrogenase family)